jgi:hypothetical protein
VKLVYGVGINDAVYVVETMEAIGGKRKIGWICPFYRAWMSMLVRCYAPSCHAKRPTYIGCSVCEEWLTFSNFRRWMEGQPWEGRHLDKDIIVHNNKLYSKYACAFVDQATNSFLNDRGAARGKFPIGVSLHRNSGKLQAQCNNPFTGKQEYLGLYTDQHIAHDAWRKRKHELALMLADRQIDKRVAEALRQRFKDSEK